MQDGHLPIDDRLGPSYRYRPDSIGGLELGHISQPLSSLVVQEFSLTWSHCDELCQSVLNSEWVSHPTWASEESGFVAHKNNMYEEVLHRSEEG
jgi:hypothetical protein